MSILLLLSCFNLLYFHHSLNFVYGTHAPTSDDASVNEPASFFVITQRRVYVRGIYQQHSELQCFFLFFFSSYLFILLTCYIC